MTRKEAFQYVHHAFDAAGFDDPRREARYLIEAVLGIPSGHMFLHDDCEMSKQEQEKLDLWLQRRLNHEPLSRILGVREFWGMPFHISPETLDPRADSETLIEAVLGVYQDKQESLRVLDLGTGSGCLLITLLREFPKAKGVGVDLSRGALNSASQNAEALGVADRARFTQGSWCEGLQGTFDIIVSNPPYIPAGESLDQNVLNYDPHLALFADKDGLQCYEDIAASLGECLTEGGRVFLEIGKGQCKAVTKIMQSEGFLRESVHQDLAGIDRILVFHSLSLHTK